MKTLSLAAALLAITTLSVIAISGPTSMAQQPIYSPKAYVHGHDHAEGFIKPGAAVELIHDYDGQTRIGELETVNLSLEHIYSQGVIYVLLFVPEGLNLIQTDTILRVDLYDAAPIALPVQFSSSQAGQYNLGIDVVYEEHDGRQTRRALSLPIIVGDAAPTAKPQGHDHVHTEEKSKGGVIVLPAQEVIR